MYKKILAAIDGSELSDKALDKGLELAKNLNAQVTLLTVTELWSAKTIASQYDAGVAAPIEQYEKVEAKWAESVLEKAAEKAKAQGVETNTVHISDQHPAEGIIEAASGNDIDLIVMSSHGHRGLKKIMLGSVAQEVLAHSKIPVLVFK